MCRITLNNMQFYAHHGCFDTEQKIGTYFTVDVEYTYDASEAIDTDNVEKAINYAEVYNVIKEQMMIPSHLIENVAYRIKKALLKEFSSISSAKVTVSKLNPPIGGDIEKVSVTL